ncbi:MAG: hypothetical protein EPN25_12180 [Nitrospirae bacterium]|nr:MAG: hypothetical protein EPN25_12180 [Nitrospirota bacterium]
MRIIIVFLSFVLVLTGAGISSAVQQISFAILPMEASDNVTAEERDDAENTLSAVLIQSAKYKFVERARIDQVLSEQSFQLTGATDSKKTAAIGKILGVDKLIHTSLYRKEALTIKISVVDVPTARVEFTKLRYFGNFGPKAVAKWAAAEILMQYPLLGTVTGKEGDAFIIDLGEAHGVREGARVFVAEKTSVVDDKGGELLSDYRRVGLLEVTRAAREGSQAKVKGPGSGSRPVKTGDIVSLEPLPSGRPVISKTPLLSSVQPGRLLLEDDMKSRQYLAPGFNKGEAYQTGVFHLNATHLKAYHAYAFYPMPFDKLSNFILEGEIEFEKSSRRASGIDICFRSKGSYADLNAYRLFLSSDGRFEVRLSRYATRFGLVPLQATPLLHRGTEKNRFRIVVYGSQVDVYLNDSFLIAFEDEQLEAGGIGFLVEAGGHVVVNSIKLREAVKL